MSDRHHSIKIVSRRTGLSPHVIRVWERRYKAVEPTRTGTNRRLYSDEDIERLALLKLAIQGGHNIGNIVDLPKERLVQIAEDLKATGADHAVEVSKDAEVIQEALNAVRTLDNRDFEAAMNRGILAFGSHGLLQRVIGPLAQRIGELWRDGSIMAAHEHFASAAIRNFIGRNSKPFALNTTAPAIVVCTPSGQLHELGAVMVSAAANDMGWRVIFLGPSLPAAEIASVAVQNNVRLVALSIVYPEDDPNLPAELEALGNYLPPEIGIVAGGRAAKAYEAALQRIGAILLKDLKNFYECLDEFRVRAHHRSKPGS